MMSNQIELKTSLLSSALAAVITFFYIKLTGKDDKDLHKQVFRIFVLVFLSIVCVQYFTSHGKDKITNEPFFS
jgi:hypothetical protein